MLEKYDETKNPAQKVKIGFKKAYSSPAFILATFFGSGSIKKAPGTWGTLAGSIVFFALDSYVSGWTWLVISALLFVLGAKASDVVAADLKVQDCGSIVIDEVVAIWLVSVFVRPDWLGLTLAFILFRFFDIVKLPPVSILDKRLKNGLGVMIDDIFAAGYAILVYWLLAQFLPELSFGFRA